MTEKFDVEMYNRENAAWETLVSNRSKESCDWHVAYCQKQDPDVELVIVRHKE
jgi:hypothetical protein